MIVNFFMLKRKMESRVRKDPEKIELGDTTPLELLSDVSDMPSRSQSILSYDAALLLHTKHTQIVSLLELEL